jgi:hypothetical protein
MSGVRTKVVDGVMREHHTKQKGDLGVLYAKVDLAEKGYILLQPLSEHAPFDLVAYKDGRFLRIQVKYRSAVNGRILLQLKSSWADRHGTHIVPIDKAAIDLICVFCPETRTCYYFDPNDVELHVNLRIEPTRNNQAKHVRWARDFTEIPEHLRGVR